jgi:type IV pilus assembly protein PilQ
MKTTADNGLIQKTREGMGTFVWFFIWTIMLSLPLASAQAALKLQSIDFTTLPGDDLQLQLSLSGPAFTPRIFHTDNPARIALDLPGVGSEMEKKPIPLNVGGAESIQALEASGRTRVIINLTAMTPYASRVEGNNIYVTLQKSKGGNLLEAPVYTPPPSYRSEDAPEGSRVQNVDFRRGENGVGRLLVTLNNPTTVANIHEEGRKVIVNLPNTALPSSLARRLDVQDFATPVQTVDSVADGNRAKMIITPATQDYDYSSYQSENLLTVEFRPLTKVEKEEIKRKGFTFTGDKLSLNFQDIPVRNVLQILADFTNLNIVASDTVQGNVTLRLNEVPWDQALDLVLKARGLGKRQEGNIVRVAPLDEINKQEKEELEAQKVVEELEPLKTEIIQINYTKAEDVKNVLVGTTERTSQSTYQPTATGSGDTSQPTAIGSGATSTSSTTQELGQSILSGRGNVTADSRTNQLIVKDTARNLERVRDLIRQIDVPVRQVLIESRIVIANNDFTRQLGSRLSVRGPEDNLVISGGGAGADAGKITTVTNSAPGPLSTFGPTASGTAAGLLTSLAAASPQATAGITLLKAGDFLLDLELSAAQTENRAELLSNPRVITADQTKATIKQGEEIPYQVQTVAGGGTISNIQFKQAVTELNITPHITPDDQILMDIFIKRDSRGTPIAGQQIPIDKREIQTTAQVSNGETVVLGGVYEGTKQNTTDKVPFFGDLPGVGFMFRRNNVIDNKRELLIFITPKILKQNLGMR